MISFKVNIDMFGSTTKPSESNILNTKAHIPFTPKIVPSGGKQIVNITCYYNFIKTYMCKKGF